MNMEIIDMGYEINFLLVDEAPGRLKVCIRSIVADVIQNMRNTGEIIPQPVTKTALLSKLIFSSLI